MNEEDREKVTVLADEDIEAFFESLDNPPPPNEKMKEAFDAHARKVKIITK